MVIQYTCLIGLLNPLTPLSHVIKKLFSIAVIFACLDPVSFAQKKDTSQLTLLFAGDIMGHEEQIAGAWSSSAKKYNYEPTFRYVKPLAEEADIAIANLEVTLAGEPYRGYPQFSSPDALATAARDAGFDVFLQANNHALDRGKAGFVRTLTILDSLQIIHTGTFLNPVNRHKDHPLILERNGIRIALLNYTYSTNGISIPKPYIINRIDTALIRRDLKKARLANPHYIFVALHWGEEYQRNESVHQKNWANFILKNGADAIIGSHPHVVQPISFYAGKDSGEKKIIVYSQGNFVSNQRAQYKDGGILIELKLQKTDDQVFPIEIAYIPTWVYRSDSAQTYQFTILPVSLYEKNSAFFHLSDHDKYKLAQFASDTRQHLKNVRERLVCQPLDEVLEP